MTATFHIEIEANIVMRIRRSLNGSDVKAVTSKTYLNVFKVFAVVRNIRLMPYNPVGQ
jgi:hypothetical protein